MNKKLLPKSWKEYLGIIPMLQFLGWPAFMFMYATKSGPLDGLGLSSMTNAVCFAAGGVYFSAFLWAFIGRRFKGLGLLEVGSVYHCMRCVLLEQVLGLLLRNHSSFTGK
jgi:hypothetical protein